jgi:hypothetical protein
MEADRMVSDFIAYYPDFDMENARDRPATADVIFVNRQPIAPLLDLPSIHL